MKAHIIKEGIYKGMKFTKGLVYSVSDPTLAELIRIGIALDTRPKVTVDAKEVKAPKAKAPKEKVQVVSTPKPKVSKPSLLETKEEKHENPIEE